MEGRNYSSLAMKFVLTPASALFILSTITPNCRTSGLRITICRFQYKPSIRDLSPNRVEVYCKCEKPINPDEFMVHCDECEDRYINFFSAYVVIM